MTISQGFAFAILLAMMGLFIWGRIRYDVVALLALLASVATGIVPAQEAFSGFSDDIVIIVGSALIVSAAITRSGVVETVLRRVGPSLNTAQRQVVVLVLTVTLLAAVIKNIGAVAMLLPVAFQLARQTNTSPSCLLMPLSFGSLLGGLMTLIGTSPNLIVSRVREEIVGEPYQMFDFLPVGAGIAFAGVIFLAFGYRLLPTHRKGPSSMDVVLEARAYTAEAIVPEDSPFVGRTVAELQSAAQNDVSIVTIVREKFRRYTPTPDWVLKADDALLLEGQPADLDRIVARAKLQLPTAGTAVAHEDAGETTLVEAVVTGDSPVINQSPLQLRMYERFRVVLLAISRSSERITRRLRSVKFNAGDLVVLKGNIADIPDALSELRFLPLAGRDITLGNARRSLLPVLLMIAAMALATLQIVPVAIAFFGAAVLLIVLGSVPLRRAYEAVDAPVLVLLAALIPVSEAVQTTGGTELMAAWLFSAAHGLPPSGAMILILVTAMAVTPFLNNAATVLMLAPIAASLSQRLGYSVDPFLMAVAIGAACDFLTPFGHQCNTLVMGPGGYRFGDYWKLGLPLSIIVVVISAILIPMVWPLARG